MTLPTRPVTLSEAYAACRAFTKQRARNFYYAFAPLPKDRRNAIYAAYAFAGRGDDAVDGAGGAAERELRLRETEALLEEAYAGRGEEWLTLALADTVARYVIPKQYFLDLIAGMEQDLQQRRYSTYAELEQYCYRAASVIGLISTEIFGYDAQRRSLAVEAAVDMGKALQLTNIMRDVKEDAARGRIYLAQEDLARYGYSEADLRANIYNPAFRALMAEYAQRARTLYESGLRLIPLLDGPRSRMCCYGVQGVYRGILEEIIRRDYDVYSQQVSPSSAGRLRRLVRLWVGGALPRRRPPATAR